MDKALEKTLEALAENPDVVSYHNGNYWVFLNLKDGTKVRYTPLTKYLSSRPESIDLKITDYCDQGCPWCHEDSSVYGEHATLDQSYLDTFPEYTEIALGGGNVLSHPDLIDFLYHLKSKKCVPSITVNQSHFLDNFDFVKSLYDSNLVYGVGVSLTEPSDELIERMREIPTSVLHTIVGILTKDDIEALSGHDLKILLLGYKRLRRGSMYVHEHEGSIKENTDYLGSHLDDLFRGFEVVSFDNLALGQLPVREYLGEERWSEFYMGDDGEHTFYVDAVRNEFAESSTSTDRYAILGEDNICSMFNYMRSQTYD